MARVVIVQRRMTHYRVPLLEAMRQLLDSKGVRLNVLVGTENEQEKKRFDSGALSWATQIPTRYLWSGRLCWQPVYRYLDNADMLVITQENALLVNHLLLIKPRKHKLAFWGHGANLQSTDPQGLKEFYKRWTSTRVDWWFAYTQLSRQIVTAAGFPDSKITVVDNAIDTSALKDQRRSISEAEIQALRTSLGFGCSPVGAFLGSLTEIKRLDFLFLAAEAIRRYVPNFCFLILGAGPESEKVRSWSASRPWTYYAGPRFGREKALFLSIAKVMLNPGMVGLGILDSFACAVPVVTTNWSRHSPEIAYLENGVNGIITADSLDDYTRGVVHLLTDNEVLQRLRSNCQISGARYSIENMARRFTDGIVSALSGRQESPPLT